MARKVTLATLADLKARNERAVFLTAYDYPTATFADRAGADLLLVGDSAAMTMLGHPTTLGIGLVEMLVFARAVARAARRALVVGDLPFLSYQPSDETAAQRIAADAAALAEAGVFAILLEAMPAETAAYVRDQVAVPVYGIGAGPLLDGQLVISHDILGTFVGDIAPRFVRRYAAIGDQVEDAFRRFGEDVRRGAFPGPEQCYPIEQSDEAEIRRARVALHAQPAEVA